MKRTPLRRKTPLKRSGIKAKPTSPLAKRKADVSSKYWLTKCDKIWSELIRSTGSCVKCGKHGRTEAHHLITRARKHLRHKLECGIELCMRCHKFGAGSAHDDPVVFTQWLAQERPDQYDWVMQNKHKTFHGKPNYKEVYEALLAIKEAMQ